MANDLILETTFLIDFEREIAHGTDGPAHRFLTAHGDSRLHITFTVAGELAAGQSLGERRQWEEFVSTFRTLQSNPNVCWAYGQTYQYLQTNGLLIAANDLWIAATALSYEMPLVTRNVRDFQRVPGLRVESY